MSQKTDIIHLVSNREWGGGEQYVFNLCQHFVADNYNVTIFSRPVKQVVENFALLKIPVYKLPLKGIFDLFSAVRLSSFIKDKQCIIHVHNFKDAFTAVFARIFSGNSNVRIILTRHLVRKGKTSRIYRWLYKQLDKIVFVSELAKKEFLSTGITIVPERTTIVRNSIVIPDKIKKVDIRQEFSLPQECTIAMYHGRIAAEKGLNILIDAMQIIKEKNIFLLLIGTGEKTYVSSLQQRVKEYRLEKQIKFAGYRSPVLPYLQECNFGILPSIVKESSSLSCMDYMSQGRTVIATNNGGQTEYLTDGVNSLLVPPGDAKMLAEKISALIDDKEKCAQLGENAFKDYNEKLNYNCFLKEITKAYGF